MQEAAVAVFGAQPLHEFGCVAALGRAERVGVPLGAVAIVDRHEGRLAALREPHVAGRQRAVHLRAERQHAVPLRFRTGFVTRGDSYTRVTVISCSNDTSHSSISPSTGAALVGCGVQASGMWPSPASRPEVGSKPIQPAPGRYTSHHACRSVKSTDVPLGPSSDFTSGVSWIR